MAIRQELVKIIEKVFVVYLLVILGFVFLWFLQIFCRKKYIRQKLEKKGITSNAEFELLKNTHYQEGRFGSQQQQA